MRWTNQLRSRVALMLVVCLTVALAAAGFGPTRPAYADPVPPDAVPAVVYAHPSVYDGGKIAIVGAVYAATDVSVTFGTYVYTASSAPDAVRLNADGSFVFAPEAPYPAGVYSYEVTAANGAQSSAPEAGTVEVAGGGSGANALLNAGFETAAGGGAASWAPYGGAWGGTVERSAQAARSGQYGVAIATASATANPWVKQTVADIEEGATYEFSVWIKRVGATTGSPGFKVEFYTAQTPSAETWITGDYAYKLKPDSLTGDWQQVVYRIKAPAGAQSAELFVRLYGAGAVAYDDAEARLVREANPLLALVPDQVFYDSEAAAGTVDVAVNAPGGDYTGRTVDLWIYEPAGGQTLLEKTGMPAAARLSAAFAPGGMTLHSPYRVKAVLRDAADNVLAAATTDIYRWERPTMLAEDGTLQVDGEPFYPIFMYHVPKASYPLMSQIGVNAVQGDWTRSLPELGSQLDQAQANGLKVLVTLYVDGYVKENFTYTEQAVEAYRDHPAVLGWYVIDEPNERGIDPQELTDAYKLIRSIDPAHPVFIMESRAEHYADTGKVVDALGIDVYPLPDEPLSAIGPAMAAAKAAVGGKKPVWEALQAFQMPSNPRWTYLPTIGEIRNMAYQSLLAGGRGLGYYSFSDPGWLMSGSALWPGMVRLSEEYGVIAELATTAGRIGGADGEAVRWGLWHSGDGDAYYAVAVNVTKQRQTAAIALPFAGYRAELLYGDDSGDTAALAGGLDDTLPVALGAEAAFVYRIVPLSSDAEAARAAVADAVYTIAAAHWQEQTSLIAQQLGAVRDWLAAATPPSQSDLAFAASAGQLHELAALRAWVDGQSDAALAYKRSELLAVIDNAAGKLRTIAQSLIRQTIEVENGTVVADAANELTVRLASTANIDAEQVRLTVTYPAAFGLPPAEAAIGTLQGVTESVYSLSFAVPYGVAPGAYPLQVQADFNYDGASFSATSEQPVVVVGKVDAALTPGYATVAPGDDVPFAVELRNNAASSAAISWQTSLPDGFAVDLASPVTLAAGERRTVQGTVYVAANVTGDVYALAIRPVIDGTPYDALPLGIAVDNGAVANPGFETAAAGGAGPAGWNLRAGLWEGQTQYVHSGSRSARIRPDAANAWNVIDSASIAVTPGHRYTMSGWVRNLATAGKVDLGVRLIDGAGATIRYDWQPVAGDSGWTRYELTFTAPAGAASAQIFFKMDQQANGVAFLDDVYLKERDIKLGAALAPDRVTVRPGGAGQTFGVQLTNLTDAPLAIELPVSALAGFTVQLDAVVALAANEQRTVTGTVYAAATVTDGVYAVTIRPQLGAADIYDALTLTVATDSNMAPNPGFETAATGGGKPAGWNLRAGLWEGQAQYVHSGSRSARIRPDAANAWNVIDSDSIAVTPGHVYELSGWVRNLSTTGAVHLGVRLVDGAGNTIVYQWQQTANNSGWTNYKQTFTAPANAANAQIFFKTDQSTNGVAFLDDLFLKETSGP
ncbi:MAG: carbohydrate binding domain-containing protein [Paenibacillaceae bacterium]|nr:carbohydrate binding domain-containing protein [Paenibacillaceae bacterium]